MERIALSVRTLRHPETGLLMAVSDTPGFEGLYIAGRTHQELNEWINTGITQLLEAKGYEVIGQEGSNGEPVDNGWMNDTPTDAAFSVREAA